MDSLKDVLGSIEKRFGKEAISDNKIDVETVSTGILSLDIALGGGVPKGRLISISGFESSGKSTIALHIAAEVQKLGKIVAYIDQEFALDKEYAKKLGVSTKSALKGGKWLLTQPDSAEECLELTREFLKTDEIGLIVIDSVASMSPKAVQQGEAGDAKMALLARLLSSMVPTMTSFAHKSGCIVMFINQLREKPGVMYGSPVYEPGGNTLKFYVSQRLEVARSGQNKVDDKVVSNKTRVKITKNKVAPPYEKAEFEMTLGNGVDTIKDIISVAVDFEIIKKAGSWFSYGETRLGQGTDKVKILLQDNPELVEEITEKIYKKLEK